MPLDNLSELSTLLAAISLATERLVVIVKTIFPRLGAAKTSVRAGESDDEADRVRRLTVLAVAYVCALATVWIIAGSWTIEFGAHNRSVSIFGVALLACGGSAFWSQIVSFASAAKDVRQMESKKLHDDAAPQPVLVVAPAGGAPTHIPALPVPPR